MRGSTMQQRSIVVLLVAAALPAPVRPEPFWQRWQDSVIERLGVNYSSYVAAQVHKFDRKVAMNPEGSLDKDAQSKKPRVNTQESLATCFAAASARSP